MFAGILTEKTNSWTDISDRNILTNIQDINNLNSASLKIELKNLKFKLANSYQQHSSLSYHKLNPTIDSKTPTHTPCHNMSTHPLCIINSNHLTPKGRGNSHNKRKYNDVNVSHSTFTSLASAFFLS